MSNLEYSGASLNFDGAALLGESRSPLMMALCQSVVVRRLKDISFLGAIDYSYRPVRRTDFLTTRFDHSVGVAFLARTAAEKMNVSEYETQLAMVAGLLHDIGHGPLSHSLEPRFSTCFGLNHHIASEGLISGDDENGKTLREILRDFRVHPRDIVDVLNGVYASPITQLFSCAINVDTIEGIHRAAAYHSGFELKQSPSHVAEALVFSLMNRPTRREIETLDTFWALKNQVYFSLIRSDIGVLSDLRSQLYFDAHRDRFRASDFFMTDTQLGARYKGLFSTLRKLRGAVPEGEQDFVWPDVVDYQQRSFFVDEFCALDGSEGSVKRRYRQSKQPRKLLLAAIRKKMHQEDGNLELSENFRESAQL
ncbi:MAG: HD domain-containing protein [Ramlibacter sp.]